MHAAQPPTSPPTQALIPGTANASTPFADEQIILSRQEYIQLQSDLNRVTSLHQRALKRERWYKERCRILLNLENFARRKREADLIAQLKTSTAKVRDLQQRLFGKQSEKGKGGKDSLKSGTVPQHKRNKGHQPGGPTHGRTMHPELPEVHEHCKQDDSVCPACHKPWRELCTTEDSSVIEIEVKAYVRKIHRHHYIQTCDCPSQKLITCAPVPAKLIPKGKYGISVWGMILLDKYLGGTPTERLLQKLNHIGLRIAPGTIVDGLKKIAPLFEPIDAALLKQLRLQKHWHADETRWAMFVDMVGKIGHRWYLWVFHSAQVVHYVLDPSRASQVVIDEFEGVVCGIISCDRYSGYKGFANETPGFELAFCWVHQRRDFLNLANSYPEHLDWAFGWVQSIGHLYHLNVLRLQASTHSPERTQAQSTLVQAVQAIAQQRDLELQNPKLGEPCQKVLQSMTRHWAGLTVFVRHSEVPMDNNTAERDMRGPVVGRKNFFGSGALWSGQLAATLYSLFATLKLYDINARTWMLAYLQACTGNGGQPPKDLSSFLPWAMDEARLQVMRASVPMAPMEPITPHSAAPPSPPPSRGRSGGPAPPKSQATPGQTANQTATQATTRAAEVDSP
jgi:transposase